MPVYCSPSPMYDTYCAWCRETHRPEPTRAWWDNSCNQPRGQADRKLTDDEFDDETEAREGWVHG